MLVGGSAASLVAGLSPARQYRCEILAVDRAITVEVGGAGVRAVVARSAFGPAAAEFGAGGFGDDRAATCDTACAGRYWFLAGRVTAVSAEVGPTDGLAEINLQLNTFGFQTACTLNDVRPDGVGLDSVVRDHGIEVAVAVEFAEGD